MSTATSAASRSRTRYGSSARRIDSSAALESSVGIAAGVALAAALPELPYACGLATVQLLTADVVVDPLLPVDGVLPVGVPVVDEAALAGLAASPDRVAHWEARLAEVRAARRDLRQDGRS